MNIDRFLDEVGLEYIQGSWKKAPPIPYIVYHVEETNNITADSKVAKRIPVIDLELYTEKIDRDIEQKVTKAADKNGMVWEQTARVEIPDQKMWMVKFSIPALTDVEE